MGIRAGNGKSSKMWVDSEAEYPNKLGRISSQDKPIVENPWILQPNRQPLGDFPGELTIFFASATAGDYQLEFAFQTENRLAGAIILARQFLHPRYRSGRSIEVQFFRRKQTRGTPAHVFIENVRMDELNALIRPGASFRSGTLKVVICHGSF